MTTKKMLKKTNRKTTKKIVSEIAVNKTSLLENSWQALEPGDVVDIVAPASDSTRKDFKKAIKFVEKFGLIPRFPKDLFGEDVICSNTDKKRFEHLKKALKAKDSKVIWCLRGGYGSGRLLGSLDKLKKPKQAKLLVGYSDITSLHNFLNNKWNWPTLHASMLEEFGAGFGGRREINDMKRVLFGVSDSMEFRSLTPMNSRARQVKTLRSSVVGGNLCILTSTLGTPWHFNPKGKILAIEEIGERGYQVDRMLNHLHQAGYFKGLRALIFGDFVGGEEKDSSYLWKQVRNRFAKEADFPVLKGLPFGHGSFQRPMPFNTKAELKLGPECHLRVKTQVIR